MDSDGVAEPTWPTAGPVSKVGPLTGIRVLELGSFIAGPFAGQLLADYGADVIKIEPVGSGDPMRRWGTTHNGQSLWWPAIARNKKSVALDLRAPEARAVVRRLVANCDVVLENFRPGRLTEWQLGYDDLVTINPAVIMIHVSGFGQTGPRAAEAGFGSIGEAVGGVRFTTGAPEARPSRTGISLGDSLAALFAVVGTLAAVVERNRSGRGQEVDVAIYEAVAALMESTMVDYERAGVLRTRTGSVLPGVAPSNVYPSADGVDVVVAANADAVFKRLCVAMGAPELAGDPRFAAHGDRGKNATELDELIEAWSRTLPTNELLAVLAGHGVPAGKIYSAPDMLDDEHYSAREMVLRPRTDDGENRPMTGIVPKFSRTPGAVTTVGPALGADTLSVLRELAGTTDEEWQALLAAGLVQSDTTPASRETDSGPGVRADSVT
jgi:formyl-CoA transferase